MTFVVKRFVWWASGAVMGAGGSVWAQRKVKRVVRIQVDRVQKTLKPVNVAAAAKGRVLSAVRDGKSAAADREIALRSRLEDARTARAQRRSAS